MCDNCINKAAADKTALMARTDAIIDRIGTSRDKVIPLLQALQEEFNYLQSDVLERVYDRTEIDRAQLVSVSTFYSLFRHIPYGKHVIKICNGTACHVKGSDSVYDAFRRELKMGGESITTTDGEFSIEKIACLGVCALAPVVQIDEKIYGHVQPGRVKEVIDAFREFASEKEKHNAEESEGETIGEIRLGMENCCQASGTAEIYKEVVAESESLGLEVKIKPVSCVGACNQVPLIDVAMPDGQFFRYPNVKPTDVREILMKHFKPKGKLRQWKNILFHRVNQFQTDEAWDSSVFQHEEHRTRTINNFFDGQLRISTEGYGKMSPLDIDEYIARGGFEALRKAVKEMTREEIIDTILKSGIRGRGGGGFPTGRKWQMVAAQDKPVKYVICNGDEGDPGAFMDRILLESYPLRVIEGLIIAGYAVGASDGIFYIRAEYPQAVIRIRKALEMCKEKSLIGDHIMGTDFSFNIRLFEGAGAFVCGEETALISSIEGNRGFPKLRPPYPAISGLYGCPTLINNVETLSQVSFILSHGAAEYAMYGTESSKGTKVFALVGKVNHGGLIEVPMGTTLNQIIEDIGGGVEGGEKLKAVQTGGPSGGCIPASECDVKVDYEALKHLDAIMGSGGLVVLGESSCMVDVARYFTTFTSNESCGKCTFCRVGVKRMLDLLDKICTGKGKYEDIDKLEDLAKSIQKSALCGLGKTAPNPVLSTLKYFREEYDEHIQGICKTGTCNDMIKYVVTDDCMGCTKCAKACPSDAIPYTPYVQHSIDVNKCVKCGLCINECSFNAIKKVPINS